MEVDQRQAVQDLQSLIDLVDEALPKGGEIEVPARPAPLRAVENIYLTRRTAGSIRRLMEGTVSGEDEDRTEDAALLVRRLLELLADTYWMTTTDTDPDHQARRAMLKDLDEQAAKCKRIIETESTEESVGRAKTALERIEAETTEIEDDLVEAGLKARRKQPVAQILESHGKSLSFYWSFESDVAHAGVVGRGLQRDDSVDVGADAPEWRRALIIQTAFSASAEIFDRSFHLLGLPKGKREAFVESLRGLPSSTVLASDIKAAVETSD